KHDGRFPLLPSYQALEKVNEFFRIISSRQNRSSYNFVKERIKRANTFFNSISTMNLSSQKYIFEDLRESLKLKADTSLREIARVVKRGLRDGSSVWQTLLEVEDRLYSKMEKDLVRKISNGPHRAYDDYRARILRDGVNTSFKSEFEAIVRKLDLALRTAKNVEEALKAEPKLALMHRGAIERIETIIENGQYPYRRVLDEVARVTEFFDMVERSYGPQKSNPLHYAKRYEYYLHSVFGWAPDHITILSSSHLKTYDLLSISSAPIGFAGVATESLWVDSYLQSPNEFLLHDAANHERRRFQFTRNYFFRLGLKESDFAKMYHNIDAFLQKEMLPLIRRIDRFASAKINFTNREKFLEDFLSLLPGPQYFQEEIEELKTKLASESILQGLNDEMRIKINRKKTLYDMILFEVVHEDALPPAKFAIFESLMRPPNLPMPRDFIDIDGKVAHHTMEPAGTTMAYILEKLNGSFYDTPKKRMLAVSSDEYRTPKAIIKATAEIVNFFGGYEGLKPEQVLQQLVFLTLTEEGFLTYLTEEFQRDLHPIQRNLLRSLKFAEGLEVLSLVGEFRVDKEFKNYMKALRERIVMAQDLENGSSDKEVTKVLTKFSAQEKSLRFGFEQTKDYYFKLGQDLNERTYHRIKAQQSATDVHASQSIKELETEIKKKELLKDKLRASLSKEVSSEQFESLEKLSFETEHLRSLIIKRRRINLAEDFVKKSKVLWEKTSSENIPREVLISRLAKRFHDESWRPNFQSVYGSKAQYRDVPVEAFNDKETDFQARARYEKADFIGLRINADGKFQQNINLASEKLIPELFSALNERVASRYVDLIIEAHVAGEDLSLDLIESMAVKVHDIFMDNNVSKLSSALKKLGHPEISDFREIMFLVENLNYTDWEKLNIDEVKALKQFRPKNKLTEREVSNDKSMIVRVMDQMFESTYGIELSRSAMQEWSSLDFTKVDIDFTAQKLAERMHTSWKENYNLQFGSEPRYRSIPMNYFVDTSPEELLDALDSRAYKGLIMDPVKGLSQNINQSASEIVPELFYELAVKSAKTYIRLIESYRSTNVGLTEALVRNLSEQIHELWIDSNKWQIAPTLKRFNYDVEKMSSNDIRNFILNLEKSQWLQLNSGEIEKLYQFKSTNDLSWDEHRKNYDMLRVTISVLAEESGFLSCNHSAKK
ncbi:MAG: hypothetical protein VX642_15010, partial [Bdellovibrionota bacterium]|nr:hypothetical protein [Bdellovibrionota bacterium]